MKRFVAVFPPQRDTDRDMGHAYLQLSEAATIEEILRVTREYVQRARATLAELPPEYRPAGLRSARDIELWADRLNEASEKLRPLTEEQTDLDRLASHFLIASLRVRQLGAPAAGALRAAA